MPQGHDEEQPVHGRVQPVHGGVQPVHGAHGGVEEGSGAAGDDYGSAVFKGSFSFQWSSNSKPTGKAIFHEMSKNTIMLV